MFWTLFVIVMILWGLGVLIFQVIRDRCRNIQGRGLTEGFRLFPKGRREIE